MNRFRGQLLVCSLCFLTGGWMLADDFNDRWAEVAYRSAVEPGRTDAAVEKAFVEVGKLTQSGSARADVLVSLADSLQFRHLLDRDGERPNVFHRRSLYWNRKAIELNPSCGAAWWRIVQGQKPGSGAYRQGVAALARLEPDNALGAYLGALDISARGEAGAAAETLRLLGHGNQKAFRIARTPAPTDYAFRFPDLPGFHEWAGRQAMPRHVCHIFDAQVHGLQVTDASRFRALARKVIATAKLPKVPSDRAIQVIQVVGDFGLGLARNGNRDPLWALTGGGIASMSATELRKIYEATGDRAGIAKMDAIKVGIQAFIKHCGDNHLNDGPNMIDLILEDKLKFSSESSFVPEVSDAEALERTELIFKELYAHRQAEPKAVADALEASGLSRMRFVASRRR